MNIAYPTMPSVFRRHGADPWVSRAPVMISPTVPVMPRSYQRWGTVAVLVRGYVTLAVASLLAPWPRTAPADPGPGHSRGGGGQAKAVCKP